MRHIFILILLLPGTIFSQEVMIDTVGKSGRIKFLGSSQTIQIGEGSGNSLSTGLFNTYIGNLNGSSNLSGERNLALGTNAGFSNTTGSSNVNLGVLTGGLNQSGVGNINIGDSAGYLDDEGSYNVKIGNGAGAFAEGSGNVLIGNNAGFNLQGDNKLVIENSSSSTPLIEGDFAADDLVVNGNLHVTGKITGNPSGLSISTDKITGQLGSGYSSIPPNLPDNTAEIEIVGIITSNFLITSSLGYEIDTFSTSTTCTGTQTGFNAEFPVIFETDQASDIATLSNWFSNPDTRIITVIIKDAGQSEVLRYNLFEYTPDFISAGSGGRTAFTLKHTETPNGQSLFEQSLDFGSQFSFNSATDKLVEINGVSHPSFCPAVQVNHSERAVVLEFDYNEGEGLYDWARKFAEGDLDKRSMTIIETPDGSTEISRENFYEVSVFRFEVVYGFGLDTKLKARITLFYGCSEPG